MRSVADVIFGEGGTLVFDAPEGRPSAVTVKVYPWAAGDDDLANVEAATGSATVEASPNTTTDEACGAHQSDRCRVPLTTTTGAVVGRIYRLTGALGQTELVQVLAIDPGVSITAKHPLLNDYAAGASFVTTRMTAAVDVAWASDSSRIDDSSGANPMYRVKWVYTVDGIERVADTYFNLKRYGARHGVTPQDVDEISAGWMDRLPIDHRFDQGARLIDAAFRAVKMDLRGVDLSIADVAESEIIDVLTAYMAAAKLDPTLMDDYTTRKQQLIAPVQRVNVRDATGAAQKSYGVSLTRR